MPVVFMTAWYALHELGRMRRGEWALIHAAAGGVGLAAVQLCRRAGVTIIATAGSPEKRAYLHTLGIEHVLDSRTLDFADQVLAITGGRGVDLVLNSLAGDAIARGMACLAPRGRFLEIGKRDIYANNRIGLEPFKRSLAFFAIDLAGMTDDAPDEVAALFRTVIEQAASGNIQPLPTQAAPATDAEASFRTMAQAQHIGKLVLTFDGRPVSVPKPLIASDATYLITGGLGGLGLALARRLVQQGARHLALIGRSAPSEAARAELAEMEAAGAHARSFAADVAQAESLQHALDTIAQEMPPLRGIFHAAGLLADATVTHLDRAQLHAALAPKLQGGWNLHALTQGAPLDYFVCFSSVAALLGLAGQANYAAGNTFLDTLAHQRRRMGLPGLSINWGPWAEVGLAAAEAPPRTRLAERGLGSLTVQEGLTALEHLLHAGDVQAAVVRLDTTRWLAHDPAAAALLTDLRTTENAASAAAPAKVDLRTVLLATDAGRRRRTLLEDAVRRQLAHVLRIAPDRIERTRPLKALGLDSLMALELRNRLEAETGLTLSATLAFNYPTVALLSDFLAERMQVALEAVELETAPSELDVDPERAEAVGDALSSDEIDALLSDELAAIDRLLNPH